MIANKEREIFNNKYNFLTELKLVRSLSSKKGRRKLKLAKLEESIKRMVRSRSKSHFKKKKKNRKYKYLNLYQIKKKSNVEIEKKNIYEFKFKVLFGKIIVKKKYLQELADRKKQYSEKVKKIKIIKRANSISKKEETPLDIIKRYSLNVLNTNRAIINSRKEKTRELFEKLESIDKNKNNLNNPILETPQINQKLKLLPIANKINLSNNKIIINSVPTNNSALSKINIKSNIPSINLRKDYEINKSQISDKKEKLNQSNPNIVKLKLHYRNKQNDLKLLINDINKSNIISVGKSCEVSPKKIDISDMSPSQPKKLKRERSDLCKDFRLLYYAITPGNASYLVKNCMLHRTNWKESYSYVTNIFNFKWQSISQGIDYDKLGMHNNVKQIVNHFENHSCLSNKANMFMNMMDYCEQRKISVLKYIPLTLIFELNMLDNLKDEIVQKKLEKLKKFIDDDELTYVKKYEDIGLYFKEEEYIEEKKRREEFFKESSVKKNKILYYVKDESEEKNEDEKINFEGKYPLYRDYFGKIKFSEKIETKLKNNYNCYSKERERMKKMNKLIGTNTVIELPITHSNGKHMWIIKAINLNRGMCIKIVNSYDKMMKILNKFKEGVKYDFTLEEIEDNNSKSSPKEEKDKKEITSNLKSPIYNCNRIIIQKYIEKPLLYFGRKCDMRIWVLVTHTMNVYFFKEGHLKTCSISFDLNSENAFSHITNYSFQKYNSNFQKYEKGNEVPFSDFQKFIDKNYPEKNYKIKKDLYAQIKEIIEITMQSVREQINKNSISYQFEIFGYDFMLDENFNLFLIEINTNPGLEESSPWIQIIVPRMLDDALRLTIDQLFYPGYDFAKSYKKRQKSSKLKIIMNNFKDKINEEKKTLKRKNSYKLKKNKIKLEDKIEQKMMETKSYNIKDLIDKIDKKESIKIETKNNKNDKYISPFPVPGYKNEDNLWEFVCDLNAKDPLDDFLDKDDKDKVYTGFRYLFNKKKNNET